MLKGDKFRLVRSLFVLLRNNGLVAIASYMLTIALANYFGPAIFGEYSEVVIAASAASIFITYATDQTAPVDFSRNEDIQRVLISNALLRLILALIAFAIGLFVYWNQLVTLGFICCLAVANFNLSYIFEIQKRNELYSFIYLIERLSYIFIIFILVFFENLDLACLFLILAFCSSASLLFQYVKFYNARLFSKILFRDVTDILLRNLPIVLIGIATFAYGGFNRLILGDRLGTEALGIFSVGWQLITIGTIYQGQVTKLWRLDLSKAVADLDMNALVRLLRLYFLLSTIPIIILAVLMALGADIIVDTIFTASYQELATILPIFAIYLVIVNLAGLMNILWIALGRNQLYMTISVVMGGLSIGYLLLFAFDFSIENFASVAVLSHTITVGIRAVIWWIVFRNKHFNIKV